MPTRRDADGVDILKAAKRMERRRGACAASIQYRVSVPTVILGKQSSGRQGQTDGDEFEEWFAIHALCFGFQLTRYLMSTNGRAKKFPLTKESGIFSDWPTRGTAISVCFVVDGIRVSQRKRNIRRTV